MMMNMALRAIELWVEIFYGRCKLNVECLNSYPGQTVPSSSHYQRLELK